MEVFVAMKSEVVQERKEELGRKKSGFSKLLCGIYSNI